MILETGTDAGPLDLLADYRAGESFFFASPRGTMLASGVDAIVPKTAGMTNRAALPRRVRDFLQHAADFGHHDPRVVGAVPFDDNLPAHLVLPTTVRRSDPLDDGHASALARTAVTAPALTGPPRSVPAEQEYQRGVQRTLHRLTGGELSKVVLARTLEYECAEDVDLAGILHNLALGDPGGYTFAVDLPRRGEDGTLPQRTPHPPTDRTLIGASPELLVSRRGTTVMSNPLAGSLPRSTDVAEDQRRARALLASEKDRREHAAVVDAVAAALRPLCRDLHVPREPTVVATATMWHLSTEVTGEVADSDTGALDLAVALHPTPAVCGTPTTRARTAIRETEPFDRGFYAGLVGWSDATGDGDWVVAIRCGEVEDRALRLYAGAGIVPGSQPAAELAETSAKFRTALRAMGLPELA